MVPGEKRHLRKTSRHTNNTVHCLQSWENAMVYAPTALLPYYMSYEHSWAPTFFMACVHARAIAHWPPRAPLSIRRAPRRAPPAPHTRPPAPPPHVTRATSRSGSRPPLAWPRSARARVLATRWTPSGPPPPCPGALRIRPRIEEVEARCLSAATIAAACWLRAGCLLEVATSAASVASAQAASAFARAAITSSVCRVRRCSCARSCHSVRPASVAASLTTSLTPKVTASWTARSIAAAHESRTSCSLAFDCSAFHCSATCFTAAPT